MDKKKIGEIISNVGMWTMVILGCVFALPILFAAVTMVLLVGIPFGIGFGTYLLGKWINPEIDVRVSRDGRVLCVTVEEHYEDDQDISPI